MDDIGHYIAAAVVFIIAVAIFIVVERELRQ